MASYKLQPSHAPCFGSVRPTTCWWHEQAERHALEQCVLELAGKSAALKRWLAENEAKKVDGARARRPQLRSSLACPLRECLFWAQFKGGFATWMQDMFTLLLRVPACQHVMCTTHPP